MIRHRHRGYDEEPFRHARPRFLGGPTMGVGGFGYGIYGGSDTTRDGQSPLSGDQFSGHEDAGQGDAGAGEGGGDGGGGGGGE